MIFAGLMLVLLLAALDNTIVATALPTIVGELGGLEHISWVTSAYLLAQTAVTPLYGKLGDLYGRKRVLQTRDRAVPRRLGAVRAGAEHDRADRLPRRPGPRRRRADRAHPGGGRRHRLAARARPLPGPVRRRVRRWRASPGRCSAGFIVEHVVVALDLLRQPALSASLALAVIGATLPAVHGRARPVIDYLGAACSATGLARSCSSRASAATTWAWGSAADRGRGDRRRRSRSSRSSSSSGGRPSRCCRRRCWRERVFARRRRAVADRRLRAVRRRHVPAAVLPDRRRGDADRVGPAADADDGRRAASRRSSRAR